MSRMQKDKMISQIEAYDASAEFKPADIAGVIGMKSSTCKGWLDALPDLFPPSRVDEDTGYRYFDVQTVKKAAVVKTLKARPVQKTHAQLREIFTAMTLDELWEKYKGSVSELKAAVDAT